MQAALKSIVAGNSLSETDTFKVFEAFLSSDSSAVTDAQIGAFLYGTSRRFPTVDELVGAARSLRKHMLALPTGAVAGDLIDTCGTGGSGLDSFNTSTTVAFFAAASGLKVAKHGNRGSSSRSGSADVLSALGVKIDAPIELVAQCLKETGFGFFFAPGHHPATKRVVQIRRELGFRTIFNFLGPLVNPARANYQLLGVSAQEMVRPMAEALSRLGAKRALVACGEDGLDELTVTGKSEVAEVSDGAVNSYQFDPRTAGIEVRGVEGIKGDDPEIVAGRIREILAGRSDVALDLVLLNFGAALFVSGAAESISKGVQRAREIQRSGKALEVLNQVVRISNQ